MAQSGYTPILIYASGTASNVPSSGNLTSSSTGAELALNYADGKLFYKDSGGTVQVLATKASTSGSFTTVVATTSVTSPLSLGGTSASSSLTLQSTSGVGTSDSIVLKVGNNGSVTAMTVATTGIVTFNTTGAITLPVGTTGQQPTATAGMLRFNSTTSQFEGYNGSAWASVGGSAISNDTSTATFVYPLFSANTTGTALTVNTSNANLLYKPSTGELQAQEVTANNGLHLNASTVNNSYTVATGYNAMSVGPITVANGKTVTVSSGQRWVVL